MYCNVLGVKRVNTQILEKQKTRRAYYTTNFFVQFGAGTGVSNSPMRSSRKKDTKILFQKVSKRT